MTVMAIQGTKMRSKKAFLMGASKKKNYMNSIKLRGSIWQSDKNVNIFAKRTSFAYSIN